MTGVGSGRRWPDLYVVGAGRSGTTALYRLLGQHPSVSVGDRKSPNHFATGIVQPSWETPAAVAMARHWVADPDRYLALFAGATADQVLVDVSPVHLQSRLVAERIAAVRPDARIVAVLRDPAERAVAHFSGRRRDGIETTPDLTTWLDRMSGLGLPDETAFGHYVGCGRYHHFLVPYWERFGAARVLVLFYEDLVADPHGLIDRILRFADVDPGDHGIASVAEVGRPNRSGEIANPLLRRAWTSTVAVRTRVRPFLPERLRSAVGQRVLTDLDRPTTSPALRARLLEPLVPDIEALARVTGRDLSGWLV